MAADGGANGPGGAAPPLSLLLIEDADDVRYLIASLLSRDRRVAVTAEAADAASGLLAAERDQPDVILLDLGLPDRAGLDVLPDLCAAAPRARIVVLTGDHRPELTSAVLNAGAYAYVAKNELSGRLLAVLDQLVHSSTTT